MTRHRVRVHPSERVRFVVRDAKAKEKSRRVQAEGIEPIPAYDVAEYVKLMKEADGEVLS